MPFTPSVETVCAQCGRHFLAPRPAATRAPARFCSHRCSEDHSSRPLAEKLWARVAKGDGCWEWTGYRQASGHGQINHRGKVVGVHRVAWELAVGPIPDGMAVCHHCDNPPCVKTEPDATYPEGHLFLGTQAVNMADAHAKDRLGHAGHARGEGHHNARLTEADVLAIRARRGDSHRSLAREFAVSRPTIDRIVSRETWQHI